MLKDIVDAANGMSWKACLVFAGVLFALLYLLIPAAIEVYASARQSGTVSIITAPIVRRGTRMFELLGIASVLVCVFFAIRNYAGAARMNARDRSRTGLVARLLSRFLD